jgi:hypothetical protein
VIFGQPCGAPPQIVGGCRKPLAFVGRNTAVIGCGYTRYNKALEGITHKGQDKNHYFNRQLPRIEPLVTKSNSMKKRDLIIVFFSCPKGGNGHAGYEITKLFLRR